MNNFEKNKLCFLWENRKEYQKEQEVPSKILLNVF